ncbi:MAG: putative selenate reductase subunit YgfK [Treponemataceae bacterium]
MSDIMKPISFEKLLNWILEEKSHYGTVFGIHTPYIAKKKFGTLFGRNLENPLGPAAGPHSQLAQNIVAAYYAGSRFFELKTVQKIDGHDLPVSKPCILAEDEAYNCEWSTELYVEQAMEEYIKAWFLLHVLAKEFELGSMNGFQFNMSVGYDLEGIKLPKVDNYIESMKNAKNTKIFGECTEVLLKNISRFKRFSPKDAQSISPHICNSVTLSTLHGCPPAEIERIALYLIEEKNLNTFVKCNPTLLGYDFARKTMNEMGYDYVAFSNFHFKDDLQYSDAVPMLQRLLEKAQQKKLVFGVKITNTFPVDVRNGELPSEEMYMSGKSLYPLSMNVAKMLAKDFKGALPISYSGGADFYNIKKIISTGIYPITVATTILKPGGYQRLTQLAHETNVKQLSLIDFVAVEKLAKDAIVGAQYKKTIKMPAKIKLPKKLPLTNCFVAPCSEGCPINQDITTYMKLAAEGKFEDALQVILQKNPLPFMTGTICAHNCMSQCNRNFYEKPVHIRQMKLIAAKNAVDSILKTIKPIPLTRSENVAIIGGGPAGMSAAYFLAQNGAKATIFEQKDSLGGIVRHVIPSFRISHEAVENDAKITQALGVEIKLNTKITDINALFSEGFTHVIWAVGATKAGELKLNEGSFLNAIEFLSEFKKKDGKLNLGENVIVIGGGNTAMDTVRAAKRVTGVKNASLVYRRSKRYMPADEEELILAIKDGVEFNELLSPISFNNKILTCEIMELSSRDESGRASVKSTGKIVVLPCDTLIAAVGEKADEVPENTIPVGDVLHGPATIVEAIRDARHAVEKILGLPSSTKLKNPTSKDILHKNHGIITDQMLTKDEYNRCLGCDVVCENCVEVCPNRANLSIMVPKMEQNQIIHYDSMCNECGNCASFCPYDSAPYRDKFTLFDTEEDMAQSKNEGFVVLDKKSLLCKIRHNGEEFTEKLSDTSSIPADLVQIMKTVISDYGFLL